MDEYKGRLGFVCKRKLYERQNNFRTRYRSEEWSYVKEKIESQLTVPDGYNILFWGIDGIFDMKMYGYVIDKDRLEKGERFFTVYKEVEVAFRLKE